METNQQIQDITRGDTSFENNAPHGDSSPKPDMTTPEKISIFSYVTSELTRGYLLERDKDKFSERRERVYTFMKTPRELEKFIVFGFFQCMDAFLFLFTFLPLRICLALLKIITHPCGILLPRSESILEPAQVCDLLKGIILMVCCFILNYIDTSMMYHLVRGQAIVKLYVFFNMLDMADRLFSSFGQDILDALFWTATEPRGRKREHLGVVPHLLLAIIYVIIHTLLILFQATVLNVAFNSHNKALLTIMMSNNFVEIKGSLFKKIDKDFLYHISCSDVKERFHYIILLLVVFVRNMTEFSWNLDHVWVIIPDAVLVLCAEFVVDWIKHAFILKFNEIPADVYHTYTVRLAEDMICNRQSRAFIDYSDLVSRRMGFTPLPLACLLIRICTKSFKITGYVGIIIIIALYLCFTTFKIFNSIMLLGRSCVIVSNERDKKSAEKQEESEQSSKNTPPKQENSHKPETFPTNQDKHSETNDNLQTETIVHKEENTNISKTEISQDTKEELDKYTYSDVLSEEIPKHLDTQSHESKDSTTEPVVPKTLQFSDVKHKNSPDSDNELSDSESTLTAYGDGHHSDLSPNYGTREEKYFPSFIPGDIRQRNVQKGSSEKSSGEKSTESSV